MTEKVLEINKNDIHQNAVRFETLLNKYRNQPDMVGGHPTWSREVQEIYNKIIPLIRQARKGKITKPVNRGFHFIGYYFLKTPISTLYQDLYQAYSTFIFSIQGIRQGAFTDNFCKAYEKIFQIMQLDNQPMLH